MTENPLSSPPPSRPSGRVRCEEHQVSWNTGTAVGCPLCLSRRPPPKADGLRISPFRIAGTVGLVVALFLGGSKVVQALADSGGDTFERVSVAVNTLDPAPYRAQIEALETAVYDQTPFGHGSAIFRAASELSTTIRSTAAGNPIIDGPLAAHSQAILSFGMAASASEEVGYAAFDAGSAEAQWQQIRGEVSGPPTGSARL